jgi:glycosyltransferase involved in cell wall biosynthesis
LTILEALACGTPVVATAVGGVSEQIRTLELGGGNPWPTYGVDEATGVLVEPREPALLARAVLALLRDGRAREALGRNAARDAGRRFCLERQAGAYLDWYAELLARGLAGRGVAGDGVAT